MASSQPLYQSNLRTTALREAQLFHDQNGFDRKKGDALGSSVLTKTEEAEATVATAETFREFLAKEFEADE